MTEIPSFFHYTEGLKFNKISNWLTPTPRNTHLHVRSYVNYFSDRKDTVCIYEMQQKKHCGMIITSLTRQTVTDNIQPDSKVIVVLICGCYFLQLQDYCVKAVQVLMIQNNVLSNHPNSNVYRSGHLFLLHVT